jgi:hypothetical protein
MPDQILTQQVELLTIDIAILRLFVAKMLARALRASEEPDQIALWRFVDETHKAMDEGPEASTALRATSELARARVDVLMRAVQLELKRQDQ